MTYKLVLHGKHNSTSMLCSITHNWEQDHTNKWNRDFPCYRCSLQINHPTIKLINHKYQPITQIVAKLSPNFHHTKIFEEKEFLVNFYKSITCNPESMPTKHKLIAKIIGSRQRIRNKGGRELWFRFSSIKAPSTEYWLVLTSMALTKYSDRNEIQAVIIESQIIDSHLEISGDSSSSSSEFSSFWLPSWVHSIFTTTKFIS